jgi:beta-phosphoglucomutase-like phosphatase (HAD superfamily)
VVRQRVEHHRPRLHPMADAEALRAVLAATGPILLDFDGPVTPLLPAGPNAHLAHATREQLRRSGVTIPTAVATTTDHLAVLRLATNEADAIREAVELVAIAGEVEAAKTSTPTAGAHDTLRGCREAGRAVVIVSNNAAQAVETYLDRHHLNGLVSAVLGRPYGRPDLMKPHPELVDRAVRILAADVEGTMTWGFAPTPPLSSAASDAIPLITAPTVPVHGVVPHQPVADPVARSHIEASHHDHIVTLIELMFT